MKSLQALCDYPMVARAFAMARLALLLGAIALVGLFLIVRTADAKLNESLTQIDTWLSAIPNVQTGSPILLSVNGAQLGLSSGHSDLGPSALLDHLEAYCRTRSGIELHNNGVLRMTRDSRGIVACIDTGGVRVDLRQTLERGVRFLTTGDLKELGQMRYFLVLGAGEGRSVFLSVWSLSSLKLSQLFPLAGDAPGSDLNGIPRPLQGRRVLSAGTAGAGRIVSYRAAITPDAALGAYSRQLEASGWRVEAVAAGPSVRLATKQRRAVLVTSAPVAAGDAVEADLTLCEL